MQCPHSPKLHFGFQPFKSLIYLFIYYMYVCMHVSIWVYVFLCVYVQWQGMPDEGSKCPGLQLQTVVCELPMWVLGTEIGSFGKAETAVNCWTISSAPPFKIFKSEVFGVGIREKFLKTHYWKLWNSIQLPACPIKYLAVALISLKAQLYLRTSAQVSTLLCTRAEILCKRMCVVERWFRG